MAKRPLWQSVERYGRTKGGGYSMKTAELTVEKTTQGWRVSRLGTDGYYCTRQFIGYTKAEAVRRVKQQLSGGVRSEK
jgi:hypothetical protein